MTLTSTIFGPATIILLLAGSFTVFFKLNSIDIPGLNKIELSCVFYRCIIHMSAVLFFACTPKQYVCTA